MRRTAVALAIFSGMWFSGCVTRGDDFPTKLGWIKKGETDRKSVEQLLGAPFMVGSASGTETWTYGYYEWSLFGRSLTKELKFHFEDGRVSYYSFNSNFPEDMRARGISVDKPGRGR